MKRKILAIPYIRRKGRATRFLVAQDAATFEWTFVSGTCEKGERPDRCVLREMKEETKGLITLRKIPSYTKRFRLHLHDKRVDVFFIPLRLSNRKVAEIPRIFQNVDVSHLPKTYSENVQIRFESLPQFQRRKNIWSYIWDVMSAAPIKKYISLISQ